MHERIGNNKKLKIECLRLKGMLNIDDIQFIREMAGCYYDTKGHKYDGHLRYLDISGATLTNTDNKEVSIYPRDPSEYEGTPWPSAEAIFLPFDNRKRIFLGGIKHFGLHI